jgi:hypothetical protein
VEVIGDRIVVDFADRTFLGPDAGGEIAECAASSAALISFSSDRGISQILPPVTGVMLSKYLPPIGSFHSPPI